MEDFDAEFRKVLVKVTDRISAHELNKLRFIFADQIRRDDGNNDAIDLFQQLLDRNIIDEQNPSKLINALNDIGCHPAAQLLKDHQQPTLTITVHRSLLKEIYDGNQVDKYLTHHFPQETDDMLYEKPPSNPQRISLLNGTENTTSRFTIYDKTDTKIRMIKYLMFLIGFLTYTVALIIIGYCLMPPWLNEKKVLSVDKKPLYDRAKSCQPSLSGRYFIKSRYSDKLIGVMSSTSDQENTLYQWNDRQNQLCNHQWYFVPLEGHEEDRIYIIQSVYNRKVFDVPSGNSSHENRLQQWDIATNNNNQRFRLIHAPNEDSCLIQSLVTGKVLDAITKESITQTDLQIESNTLWQLIPFDIGRPGDKLTDCPYVSSLNDLTVIKFGKVFGSNSGYSTDDSKDASLTIAHYISSISITSSDWISSIKCIYSSSNPSSTEPSKSGVLRGSRTIHSRNYRNDTFNVTEIDANERINRVAMVIHVGVGYPRVSASYIVGIQFHTTFNRTSPFYGNREGQPHTEEYPGFVLGYVRGGAHEHIERFQFVWYKL